MNNQDFKDYIDRITAFYLAEQSRLIEQERQRIITEHRLAQFKGTR